MPSQTSLLKKKLLTLFLFLYEPKEKQKKKQPTINIKKNPFMQYNKLDEITSMLI